MKSEECKLAEDLFEILREKVSCEYISDMRYEPYKSIAQKHLSKMDLSIYGLEVLNDACNYFYEIASPFNNLKDAVNYLTSGGTVQHL